MLTSEQTDGNRDGTVPLVNPITTAPRLVASQAGLFHCPYFKSRVSEDHLSKARLPGFTFSINKPVVIPQRLSLSVFAPQAFLARLGYPRRVFSKKLRRA